MKAKAWFIACCVLAVDGCSQPAPAVEVTRVVQEVSTSTPEVVIETVAVEATSAPIEEPVDESPLASLCPRLSLESLETEFAYPYFSNANYPLDDVVLTGFSYYGTVDDENLGSYAYTLARRSVFLIADDEGRTAPTYEYDLAPQYRDELDWEFLGYSSAESMFYQLGLLAEDDHLIWLEWSLPALEIEPFYSMAVLTPDCQPKCLSE